MSLRHIHPDKPVVKVPTPVWLPAGHLGHGAEKKGAAGASAFVENDNGYVESARSSSAGGSRHANAPFTQVAALRSELQTYKRAYKELNGALDGCKADLDGTRAELANEREARRHEASLRANDAESHAEVARSLRAEIDEGRERCKLLEAELVSLRKELKAERKERKRDAEEKVREINSLAERNAAEREEERKEWRRDIEALRGALATEREGRGLADRELAELRERSAAADSAAAAARAECEAERGARYREAESAASARQEADSCRTALEQERQAVAASKRELDVYKQEFPLIRLRDHMVPAGSYAGAMHAQYMAEAELRQRMGVGSIGVVPVEGHIPTLVPASERVVSPATARAEVFNSAAAATAEGAAGVSTPTRASAATVDARTDANVISPQQPSLYAYDAPATHHWAAPAGPLGAMSPSLAAGPQLYGPIPSVLSSAYLIRQAGGVPEAAIAAGFAAGLTAARRGY
ncbi:hypothetical protein PPROV_000205500 [Pycnococcus provasolii]|uniref:Uncharacterized protein n=1 Tax=Pycnococcus provasolii TaxID=41880 RepID=A0A830HBN7_9CHLO|nr:hypothetical protein PPROV_000205500 [Pycnococcus provasolii]